MNKEIDILKQKVRSEDWNTCKIAVDRLAAINSEESTAILLDMLQSDDYQIRDLAAVGMKTTRNQKYFLPLMKRINQLGFKAKIETLVSALRNFDCSRNLYDIANLNLNAGTNAEIKRSTTVILNEQSFNLTNDELETLKKLLDKFDFTIEGFDVKYEITTQ